MRRDEVVLAALAPGAAYAYTPVQVQKLLFLIDRQIPRSVEGPHFQFEPYHYGPFDRAVYDQLNELAERGLVLIDTSRSPRTFALTPEGIARGTAVLNAQSHVAVDFINRVSAFVRTQSFSSLVSAIYKAFPTCARIVMFQS